MKIIYYEGLSINPFTLFSANYIEKYLLSKVKQRFPDIEIEKRHWLSREKITDKNVVVIGHSFGGAAAVKNTVLCYALFTLDVRNGLTSFYQLNNKEVRCYNFYQLKGLRGYSVIGAKTEEVFTDSETNHINLPDHFVVWKYLKYLLLERIV